jgi:hypothetical protein
MSLLLTPSLEKPSSIIALPGNFIRPAFEVLYGFDSVVVGLAKPDITVVQSGVDGATISTTGVAGATSYTYERDTSASFTSPTTISSGTLDLTVNDTGPLSEVVTYYYRITATDGVDTSTSNTATLVILATFDTATLTDSSNLASNSNIFTFTVQPSVAISTGSTVTLLGLTGSATSDNGSLSLGGANASIFGSAGSWTQSTGTLVLTVDSGQTLQTGSDTVVTFTLTNPASGSGVISVNLSSTGFTTASISGLFLEAQANQYNIPPADQQAEAAILALEPINPSGEVTVKFGSVTYDLYVWDGSAWYIYNNDYTP